MRIIGIKCKRCGQKGELWPDDPGYGEVRTADNFVDVASVGCKCGGTLIKWDVKDNGQCWSFGEMSKSADGGAE